MDQSETASETVRRQYDWSATPPSVAIVHAIAALEDTTATQLSTEHDLTLFYHIDPDALDTLVSGATSLTIAFTIDEYAVEIDGDTLVVGRT